MKFRLIFALVLFGLQFEISIPDLSFLNGTWQVESKEQYEFREKSDNGELKGYTYNIRRIIAFEILQQ